MKKPLVLAIVLVATTILLTIPVSAQELDPNAEEPTFLEVSLGPGFLPDPFIVSALAGGDIDALVDLDLGADCAGMVASVPDIRINWTQGDEEPSGVRVFFVAEDDTTLIIQTPDGEFLCNDDNEIDAATVFDPTIDILEPADGTYNIWIGTFEESEEFVPGYLMVTEFGDSFPGQIVSPILGTIVEPEQ